MRKLYTLLFVVIFYNTAFAQLPQKMSYQSVIRNSTNQLVTNHSVGMRVSILQGSATGTTVYVETQTPTSNTNGLVTIEIGGGTPVSGTFSGIQWSTGTYFIKTETDPTGGTSYTITGTSQLLSVPYSLYAKTSADIPGLKQQIKILEDNLIESGIYRLPDIDGNQYDVIRIGTQVWMKENLKTTRYSNGDLIGTTTPATFDITGETNPKYQWAYEGNESNVATYGRLYTWHAASDSRNVCPLGWHVPTDGDWNTLGSYLGGNFIAGGKLKEAGTLHWLTPNTGATNITGFTALPAGSRQASSFGYVGSGAYFWSTGELDAALGLHWRLSKDNAELQQSTGHKYQGYSIRCIKD